MNLEKGRFRKKGSFMNYGIRVRESGSAKITKTTVVQLYVEDSCS